MQIEEYVSPKSLVTPRRLDIAVKANFFNYLLRGGDAKAAGMYIWHIRQRNGQRMNAGIKTDNWKETISDYLDSGKDLLNSMQYSGYKGNPIPIDLDGELLDGSHRVAAALVIPLPVVKIKRYPTRAWAPKWDAEWFGENGLAPEEIDALLWTLSELQK